MNEERRYDEEEIAAIFERAAEAQKAAQRNLSQEGLTLAELQEIGAEAGITPEFIAQAASAMGSTHASPPRTTYFGVPVGVSRSVDLPRPLSDEEWERLVVDLRETFQAHGKVGRHGSLRQWTNGNLKALVEPTATGYRLRLTTDSGDVRGRLMGGGMVVAMMLFLMLVVLTKDVVLFSKLMMLGLMALMGAGVAISGVYKAPRWASTREKQMEDIIERVTEMTSTPVLEPSRERTSQIDFDIEEEATASQPLRVARERH